MYVIDCAVDNIVLLQLDAPNGVVSGVITYSMSGVTRFFRIVALQYAVVVARSASDQVGRVQLQDPPPPMICVAQQLRHAANDWRSLQQESFRNDIQTED